MIELLNCGFFSYGKDDTKENRDSILPPLKIDNSYIFAIADGVGSYKGAKLASQISINHLSKMRFLKYQIKILIYIILQQP
ncbi:MAG: hypothetical protein ACL7BU_09695 [Candidatus Phlomobacter fragariae]